MKYSYLSIFAILFALSCAQEPSSKPELQIQVNELNEVLETFNKAFATGNLDILDSLTMDNYLHTNSSSKVITKKEWFNYLQKRSKQLESGEIKVLEYALEEEKITYHGPTAIVTGRVKVVTKDSLGVEENQYRITNVWVFDKGQWKRAGFHDGKIK